MDLVLHSIRFYKRCLSKVVYNTKSYEINYQGFRPNYEA